LGRDPVGGRPPKPPASGDPRLIVEIRSGAQRGIKAVIQPKTTLPARLRVGRTERADLVIDRDGELSGVHFELAWDGATCTLKDLESARGTRLGGKRIEGTVTAPHGAWIQAGDTSFSVYVEAWTPARVTSPVPERAAEALSVLRPQVGHLYAVLDAAQDRRVRQLCHESVDETRSLYEGAKGEGLADVAPYLVRFEEGSELLARVIEEGWGRSWGVFLTSRAPFKAVRRQLRRFLIVEGEASRQRLYFRYYDPRVLRAFMPLATVRQKDEIFADVIDAFVAEGERGEVETFAPIRAAARELDAAHS
jgi:hypothetical protein